MYFKLLCLIVSLLLSVPSLAGDVSLYAKSKQNNVWRLELPVPYLTNYSVFLLEKPQRLVVDLLDSRIAPNTCGVKISVVKKCRTGRLDGRRARFVLDLKVKVKIEYSNLVRRGKKHILEIGFSAQDSSHPAEAEFAQKVESIKTKIQKGKKFVVVLDPGHGGVSDAGASFAGIDEKSLTLLFSRELRAILQKEKNIEVRVTRTKDEYMTPADRLMLVRERHADMLISLHADWNADPDVKGIAVYSQSNYAAAKYTQRFLDDEAPKIINGEQWKNALPSAYDILFDITQRDTLNQSIFLSRALLREMRLYTPVLDQPHRFADFHLLSAPDVPAVLIEMGFLSNKKDLANLRSKKWRRKLAKRIAHGVLAYFKQRPKLKHRTGTQDIPARPVRPVVSQPSKGDDKKKKKEYNTVELN